MRSGFDTTDVGCRSKSKNPNAPSAPVRVLSMEKPDLDELLDELFKPAKTPAPLSLESISPRLPPEGQAWLKSLNPFCRQAVEHDLRWAGPDLFVKYWASIRDTLQTLERDFGPSDDWK